MAKQVSGSLEIPSFPLFCINSPCLELGVYPKSKGALADLVSNLGGYFGYPVSSETKDSKCSIKRIFTKSKRAVRVLVLIPTHTKNVQLHIIGVMAFVVIKWPLINGACFLYIIGKILFGQDL